MNEYDKEQLFRRGIIAAKSYLRDGYLSPGGIPKDKRPIDKKLEHAVLETWAEVVWVANNNAYTPHYWKMQLLEKASEESLPPST